MTPWPNSQHMLVAQELPCATRQAQIPLGWEFCPIFPQFCGVVRRQAHTVGAQGYSGFQIPPPLKMHFCASEALECDNIPRDEEEGHTLSGISVLATPNKALCSCPAFLSFGPSWLFQATKLCFPRREVVAWAFTTLSLPLPADLPFSGVPLSAASGGSPPLGMNPGQEKLVSLWFYWGFTPGHPQRCQVGSFRKRHELVLLLLIIPVSLSPHPGQELIPTQGSLKTFLRDSGALWE